MEIRRIQLTLKTLNKGTMTFIIKKMTLKHPEMTLKQKNGVPDTFTRLRRVVLKIRSTTCC